MDNLDKEALKTNYKGMDNLDKEALGLSPTEETLMLARIKGCIYCGKSLNKGIHSICGCNPYADDESS